MRVALGARGRVEQHRQVGSALGRPQRLVGPGVHLVGELEALGVVVGQRHPALPVVGLRENRTIALDRSRRIPPGNPMDPTAQLVVATAAFIATHFVPSTPLRAALVGRIGERAYLGLYSLVALVTLVWMARAFVHAPLQPLWPGLRHLPSAVMPFAFILLACGLLERNPTAVMQEGLLKSADPARGMIRVTRHPVMWSFMLWSGAHVLARGELNSTVFFGGFLLLAALGTVLIDRRKAARLGEDWKRFAAVTSNLPFVAIVQGRNRLAWREIGWWRPLVGLATFAVVFPLHPWLFGVRPY
jgi:uncharacterized membrane protein